MSQSILGCPEHPKAGLTEQALARAEELSVGMRPGSVLTLRKPGILKVIHGTVWLTGTPGREDIILRDGEQFTLKRYFPFVVEALADAEITLA